MYCPACGSEITTDAKLCATCGISIRSAPKPKSRTSPAGKVRLALIAIGRLAQRLCRGKTLRRVVCL